MKFFIDSADVEEVKYAIERGWVDGVTTNPSLVAKTGRPYKDIIQDICAVTQGPVSAEVISTNSEEMFREGMELAKIADNVVVKIPVIEEGIVAVRKLSAEGIKTNVTLVFSPLQAIMVAKAGATMISPFVGRIDDIGSEGMEMVSQIIQIYDNYEFETEVLVASIRHNTHILEAAMMGADIVTVPLQVLRKMLKHPLTDNGLDQFLKDYQNATQQTSQ